MTQTELNEIAQRAALTGLAQIAKWSIAQAQARELGEQVTRLDQTIKKHRAAMATINTEAQREVVGAVTAMGGQVIPAYGGSGGRVSCGWRKCKPNWSTLKKPAAWPRWKEMAF
jgi:hypothetical protein